MPGDPMTEMSKLLPCPFCGGPEKRDGTNPESITYQFFSCADADCAGHLCSAALGQWNRRSALRSAEVVEGGTGIYVASRTTRAPMWRELRESGVPITASWIDEAGEGETFDFTELWSRIEGEIFGSRGLLFYADVADAPWKGAFVEIGMALAMNKPVGIVVVGTLEGRTLRPVGSWLNHRLVTQYETVDLACKCMLAAPARLSARSVSAQGGHSDNCPIGIPHCPLCVERKALLSRWLREYDERA